jgi:hypothetical protein
MPAPVDVSIFLNNALKATHLMAELESDTPLPETMREMPDRISGHFIALDEPATAEIASAWKQTMILNATQVLYTFTFDRATGGFTARKR